MEGTGRLISKKPYFGVFCKDRILSERKNKVELLLEL